LGKEKTTSKRIETIRIRGVILVKLIFTSVGTVTNVKDWLRPANGIMGRASGSADGHDMAGRLHITGNPVDFGVMKVIEGPISGAPRVEIVKPPKIQVRNL
jgi:hypothetical protein